MTDPDRPFAGARSDVPPVRQRPPSPVRKVFDCPSIPAPARDLNVEPSQVDIIYAEDEEVFRQTAINELLKVGYQRNNIHEAENGIGALEHLARLQFEGHVTMPLLVLLDVRMPGMDGRECALQIQELVKKRLLRREPFVVCISSIHRQVTVDEGKGNFQIVLPKPINTSFLDEVLDLMRKWWTLGYGRQLAAWKTFDPSELDIITADVEPVCRLAACTAFVQAGAHQHKVVEVEDEEELMEELLNAQEGDVKRPLVVLLGIPAWAPSVRQFVDEAKAAQASRKREPFVVCTSVDSDRIGASPAVDHFHAFLPRTFSQADVKWCLEFCRLWWQTRGDGLDAKDRDGDDDSDSASSCGALSEGSMD